MARRRRSSGRRRRAVRGYTLRGKGGRVNYVGISKNPRKRVAQHRKAGRRGRLRVETTGMSRKAARRWEGTTLARHRRRHRGKNPRYNKTRSGGWKY